MKMLVAAFLAVAPSGPAQAATPSSLVLVEWGKATNIRSPEGCDQPDIICIDVEADVTFRVVRHFSGKRLRSTFRAPIVFHSDPLPSTRVLLAVQEDDAGKLRAYRLNYIAAGEKLACFDKSDIAEYQLIVPKGATKLDDRYCLRSPRWVPSPI